MNARSVSQPASPVHPLAPELHALSGRDLAGLIVSLVIVVAPHTERVPWWLTLLTAALYLWRIALQRVRGALPSRWLLLAVAGAAMVGVYAEYHTVFGRNSGIALLLVFSGLKLLEARTQRDATVTAFLCYFLVVTNFLYTQSIPTALAMCVALLAITTTLVGLSAAQRPLRANLRSSVLLLAHAAPAALVLFLLFPRVQGPLWGLPQDAYTGIMGLSDSMTPGMLARVAQSDSIAFRAEFTGQPPPEPLLYWRGPVLWDFDGRTWREGRPEFAPFTAPRGGAHYRYSVVLEPHNHHWLFALETAASLPPHARFTDDGQILSRTPVRSRIRYTVTSAINPVSDPREDPALLRRALALPRGFDPRAVALAEQWRHASSSDEQILRHAIAYFRDQRFVYTLDAAPLGRNSVDDFLFETRSGYCEYFSSAFVFLMRAAGVPARVVTGYQGGDLNPYDHYLTVRQSDAHAWAEVFLTGRGWIRVDPTALAVPDSIAGGARRAVPRGEPLPFLWRPQFEWLRGLRYQWEALSNRWNLWVLGYNPERQRELMRYFGMHDTDWRQLTAVLFTVLGALTAVLLVWSLRQLVRPDPVQRAWHAFCRKLGARGFARGPHEGPRDFSERAAAGLPNAGAAIRRIGTLYIELRYGAAPRDGKRSGAERVAELKRLVQEFHLA